MLRCCCRTCTGELLGDSCLLCRLAAVHRQWLWACYRHCGTQLLVLQAADECQYFADSR